MVGELWLLSGAPVASDIVGGFGGGYVGTMSLERLSRLGAEKGNGLLAIKLFKMLGITATNSNGKVKQCL